MKKFLVKDFEIKWVWNRSRIQGGAEGYYEVIYNGQKYGRNYPTKAEAKKYISWLVKETNKLAIERGLI